MLRSIGYWLGGCSLCCVSRGWLTKVALIAAAAWCCQSKAAHSKGVADNEIFCLQQEDKWTEYSYHP